MNTLDVLGGEGDHVDDDIELAGADGRVDGVGIVHIGEDELRVGVRSAGGRAAVEQRHVQPALDREITGRRRDRAGTADKQHLRCSHTVHDSGISRLRLRDTPRARRPR
jgi:hypothetical protein